MRCLHTYTLQRRTAVRATHGLLPRNSHGLRLSSEQYAPFVPNLPSCLLIDSMKAACRSATCCGMVTSPQAQDTLVARTLCTLDDDAIAHSRYSSWLIYQGYPVGSETAAGTHSRPFSALCIHSSITSHRSGAGSLFSLHASHDIELATRLDLLLLLLHLVLLPRRRSAYQRTQARLVHVCVLGSVVPIFYIGIGLILVLWRR